MKPITAISSTGLRLSIASRAARCASSLQTSIGCGHAGPIDSKHHRERKLILVEVGDLLFDPVFVKQEIFFLQTTGDARRVLLQHQCIDFDEIDIDLHDFH